MTVVREAYLVVVPLVTLNIAFYGAVMRRGAVGYIGAAIAGCLWCLLIGLAADWLLADPSRGGWSANAVLFLCIVIAGVLSGSAFMYMMLFGSVLREPSTTYAVFSALMRPTVPYYIAFNSTMELLLVPLVLFLNWESAAWRSRLILAAAALYVLQRLWTYAVFAEGRVKTGTTPLSDEDLAWFKRTLATDYRSWLNVVVLLLFTAAAFCGAR